MTDASNDDDFHGSDTQKDWPHDLSKLQKIGEEIIRRYEKDRPESPRAYPTAEWLTANGYSHLRYVLREYHDMGLTEFFTLLTSAQKNGFAWDIDSAATIERIETYLSQKLKDRRWSKKTERQYRYCLNLMLPRYQKRTGSGDLYAHAQDTAKHPEIYDTFIVIVRTLREKRDSDRSVHNSLRIVQRWFEWLERRGRIPANPIEDLQDEFVWNWGNNSGSLSERQVKALWKEAESIPEYLLVIGYCVWGLRTGELARVHIDQLIFDSDDPRIEFSSEESRKNGIGSVTLLFGLTILAARLDRLRMDDEWNGYLFPGDAGDGHLHSETLRRRFKHLCESANITVEGDTPTPKHGRSYYYNSLTKAETSLLESVAEFAPEQGSKDPETIVERYLDEETRREYRRVFFRIHQRNVLPEDAFHGPSDFGPYQIDLGGAMPDEDLAQDGDRDGDQ